MKKLLTTALAVLFALGAMAANAVKIKDQLVIPNGDDYQQVKLTIPAMEIPEGKVPVLAFDARMSMPTYGGWNNSLGIAINQRKLTNLDSNSQLRVLNRGKGLSCKNKKDNGRTWFRDFRGNPALLLFYAPESATELGSEITADRAAGFEYMIVIDDMLSNNQVADLEFTYYLRKRFIANKEIPAVIKNLRVELMDAAEVDKLRPDSGVKVIQLKKQVKIDSPASNINELVLEFPALDVPRGKAAVLSFNARIVFGSYGGWNNYMNIDVNGNRLERENADGEYRLLYRGRTFQNKSKKENNRDWWVGRKGDKALLVFFAPENTEEVDPSITGSRQCGFVYDIVIDDFINKIEYGADDRVESAKPNKIKFAYSLLRRHVGNRNMPLLLKDVKIKIMDKEEIVKNLPQPEPREQRSEAAATATLPGSNGLMLEVAADGALQFKLSGETVFMDSFFSYPAKPVMKYNALGKNKDKNAAGWQVDVKNSNGKLIISARSSEFEISREITFDNNRYNFRDTLKNIASHNAALAFFDRFSGNTVNDKKVKLAGQAEVRGVVDFFGSSNPTVFMAGKNVAFGAVYEDTLSRAQLQLRAQNGLYEAGSIGCGAGPGESIVREFAVYAIPTNNYFDFINQIRRDWNMNSYTIPGPLSFSRRGRRAGMPHAMDVIAPWFEFAHYGKGNDNDGALLTRDEFMQKAKPQLESLRRKNPDMIIFGMMETNLSPFDCRKYDWSKSIRQRGVDEPRNADGIGYGLFFSKEMTGKVDAVTHLKDSIIRDAEGRAMYDNMYPVEPVIYLMVQPELGNARFKEMIEQIDFLMDKVGMNGIYIDQFQPYTIGGFSENRWDGHTVEMAPDGTIKRYRYSYAITGATARAAIIKHVKSKGGHILTNGQAMSREEQNLGGLAFQEMENDSVNPIHFMDSKPPEFRWQAISHLGCPVALGIRPRKYIDTEVRPNRAAEYQTKGVITALRNGLNYCVYIYDLNVDGKPDSGSYEMFKHMYPFTPIELNEGFIIGKERVITAVSRKFTVAGSQKPTLHHYNKMGVPYPQADFAVSGEAGAWIVDVKLKDWNEVAIIEVNE
ncbi:MAG: hypothetical protein E7056_04010 [Lentisphaerae bacterium]|nr:hypothetical protein [Lentisphaerota bacterium]